MARQFPRRAGLSSTRPHGAGAAHGRKGDGSGAVRTGIGGLKPQGRERYPAQGRAMGAPR